VGGAVEDAAGALDVPEVGELLQALAALEHEVLEQVREARAALRLGAEPDVDVHGDADDRVTGSGTTQHAWLSLYRLTTLTIQNHTHQNTLSNPSYSYLVAHRRAENNLQYKKLHASAALKQS
jgi:hypothetical protein